MVPTFIMPGGEQWLLLAGYGLLGALGNVLVMYAAQYAPAAMIGPTQYSQMLWAILFGYLIFGDRIDGWMLMGIALIVGSGLLTLIREKQRKCRFPPPSPRPTRMWPSGSRRKTSAKVENA